MPAKSIELPCGASVPALGQGTWKPGGIALPKAGSRERLEENAGALARPLSPAQLQELDALFPPPAGPVPLAML